MPLKSLSQQGQRETASVETGHCNIRPHPLRRPSEVLGTGTTPPDAERLIQSVLAELGWDADASTVAARVRRLNVGLPREDEFSVVCA